MVPAVSIEEFVVITLVLGIRQTVAPQISVGALVSLGLSIRCAGEEECFKTLSRILRILLSLPTLVTLDLDERQIKEGLKMLSQNLR